MSGEICANKLCGRGRLVDGVCLICGYGFKPVRKKRRVKKAAAKSVPHKEPWWAR